MNNTEELSVSGEKSSFLISFFFLLVQDGKRESLHFKISFHFKFVSFSL